MAEEKITVKRCTCERCNHIWITRREESPVVCPKCKSPYWNKPRQNKTTYEEFKLIIKKVLTETGEPITWTEVRTISKLPQLFPNNRWVRQLESDIGLKRNRDSHGIIRWSL